MGMFPDVDEKATIANVRRFFNKDFPRLQVIAHISYVDMKGPILNGMPASHSVNNANVDTYTNHAQAKQLLAQIVDACNGLDEMHRKILELRYFKELTWRQITELLGYADSTCYELCRKAFLEFAEVFQDIEDFRILK